MLSTKSALQTQRARCIWLKNEFCRGNLCSPAFMRLPSKRQYPDYYNFIAQPICLDDIKKKIDAGTYPSLDEVRQDFELCFTNAKRYNMKDSPIWLDAKFLLKLSNKEYSKLTGKKVKKSGDSDENGEDKAEGEDGDDKKKNKPPNMNRLLKARLQKLVDKTDEDTHRILSDVFMEMPSKKDYPTYYKEIKRPICLEHIFKRLKRKEYTNSEEFANDVELVFSNALAFNQDHSQIWEDALILRDYFRQIMSDLPPPHALARYSKSSGKIKLKVPGATTVTSSTMDNAAAKPPQDQISSSLTLRLPGSSTVTKSPSGVPEELPQASTSTTTAPLNPTPVPASGVLTVATASSARVSTPNPPANTSIAGQPPKLAAPSPQVAAQSLPHATAPQHTHYPNAAYHQSAQPVPSQPSTTTATPVGRVHTVQSVSRSPVPSLSGHRVLKEVSLTMKPRGRPLYLDYRDGVKSWAMRLGQGEESVSVGEVKFIGDAEHDGSDEEADVQDVEEEEEEEEPAPKKRGRGRPPKNPKGKAKVVATTRKGDPALKKSHKPSDHSHEGIQIILNGTLVLEKADEEGVWDMELQVGSNVLEIGEKGGHVWKVFLERMSIV
ncbi:RSC complex protein [Phlebopus sp. FC_14]|nr:RSC complex protein [Phlebopus sp. FC_14]